MRIILICEVASLFLVPVLYAILHRRGMNTEKPTALALATLVGIMMGTFSIYIINPSTLLSMTRKDWLFTVGLSLFSWVFVYVLTSSLSEN